MCSQVDAAYLAGILDGEGNIRLAGRGRGKYITPCVQVTNTRYELLTWLQDRFGGSIYRNKESRPTRKPYWVWSVAGQKALHVVRVARPYLLLKIEQADILLSLKRYSTSERDSLGRIRSTLTNEARAENQMLFDRITILNKRGVISDAVN